jgi:hypothetical protein
MVVYGVRADSKIKMGSSPYTIKFYINNHRLKPIQQSIKTYVFIVVLASVFIERQTFRTTMDAFRNPGGMQVIF